MTTGGILKGVSPNCGFTDHARVLWWVPEIMGVAGTFFRQIIFLFVELSQLWSTSIEMISSDTKKEDSLNDYKDLISNWMPFT